MMMPQNGRAPLFLLLLLVGLFLAAPRPAAAAAADAGSINEELSSCVLAPLIALGQARPETGGGFALLQEWQGLAAFCDHSAAGYRGVHAMSPSKSGQLEPFSRVCGGQPGTSLSPTVVLFGDSASMSPLEATFDQEGCADLSDVWLMDSRPLAPTALELAEVSADPPSDRFTRLGYLAIFAGFLTISLFWLWMLNGQGGPARQKRRD